MHAGTDLRSYGALGSCYAGYHYDLNFLTIHGKSRFPGLAVWLQDGRRLPVSIPSGCLLIQAGKQIEWFTNGHVRAGMHEVLSSHPSGPCIHCNRLAHLGVVLRQAMMSKLMELILCCLMKCWCLLQVVCTEATCAAIARAAAEGKPLWRVSSTVFAHIASDVLLEPVGRFAHAAKESQYQPILAGDFVQQELEAIRLKGSAPC